MTIVSYAQNFEDVMLWRALSHVQEGFFLDIGAQHPIVDSVSLLFYERGWRGVHVEPTVRYASMLREHRKEDVVIEAAVGKKRGVIKFFEIPDTGISTASEVIAKQHQERGFNIREVEVQSITLSDVFDKCQAPDIHWLKIDVEGFEKQVIDSWGKAKHRPWIVVVESTLPLTQIPTHSEWENLLLRRGYVPVYFDGLNRFYISDQHPELRESFLSPPNVFDNFSLNGTASAPFHKLIESKFEAQISHVLSEAEAQRASLGAQANTELAETKSKLQQEKLQELKALSERLHDQYSSERAEIVRAFQDEQARIEQAHAGRIADLHEAAGLRQDELRQFEEKSQRREAELSAAFGKAFAMLEKQLNEQAARYASSLEIVDLLRQENKSLLEQLHASAAKFKERYADLELELQKKLTARDGEYEEKRRAAEQLHFARERELLGSIQEARNELLAAEQTFSARERVLQQKALSDRRDVESLLRSIAEREQLAHAKVFDLQVQYGKERDDLAANHSLALGAATEALESMRAQILSERAEWDLVRGRIEHAASVERQKLVEAGLEQSRRSEQREQELCALLEKQRLIVAELLAERAQIAEEYASRLKKIAIENEEARSGLVDEYRNREAALARDRRESERRHSEENRASRAEREALQMRFEKSTEMYEERVRLLKLQVEKLNTKHQLLFQRFEWLLSHLDGLLTRSEKFMSEQKEYLGSQPQLEGRVSVTIRDKYGLSIDQSANSNVMGKKIGGDLASSQVASVPDLLNLHDQDFVDAAYRFVFGREADLGGRAHYVARLRDGASKTQLLTELHDSSEGKKVRTPDSEVSKYVHEFKKAQLPFFGRFYKSRYAGEGNTEAELRVRALENLAFRQNLALREFALSFREIQESLLTSDSISIAMRDIVSQAASDLAVTESSEDFHFRQQNGLAIPLSGKARGVFKQIWRKHKSNSQGLTR